MGQNGGDLSGMGSGLGQAAGGIRSLFGHKDPNATNDILNGQVVATGTQGAQTVADPHQGLSMGNRLARGAVSGLGQGLQNQQQPQQRMGASQIQIPQAPQVNPSMFQPNQNGMQRGPRPNSMFFGG